MKTTYKSLEAKIESHRIRNQVTNQATWNLVEKFWSLTEEVPAEAFAKVRSLESRMEREHGWKR